MTNQISDVDVAKVSLVTNKHNPAVPKATTKFSIFKIFERNKVSKKAIQKIEDIQRSFTIDNIKIQ